jgi:hypothetical protein
MSNLETYHALLRSDFPAFLQRVFLELEPGALLKWGWYLDAMVYRLMRCYSGDTKRLLLLVPPRHLKSLMVSVAYPAWVLGHDPTQRIICASYSNDLATTLSTKTRLIMSTDWYQAAFPNTRLVASPNTQSAFQTTEHGGRLAVSLGGSLTGFGGNLIIVDDPHKADDVRSETKREGVLCWYRNTLLTRLDDKANGVIIVVMQRLHEYDLAGALMTLDEPEVIL